MVSECMNPDCRQKLHYLRSGRVVRVVHCGGEQTIVEHFWLCGACLQRFDFRFAGQDHVSLMRRRLPAPVEAHALTLTLVA